MRKYWHYYKLGLISTLAYRGPLLVWLLGNTLSLVAIIALWNSTTSGSLIGGYTKSELVTYYIVGLTLQWLIGWFPFDQVKTEIANGGIAASTLVKPISYYLRHLFGELGWHSVSPFLGLLVSSVLVFIYRDSVAFVHLDRNNYKGALKLYGTACGYLNRYLPDYCEINTAALLEQFESFFAIHVHPGVAVDLDSTETPQITVLSR